MSVLLFSTEPEGVGERLERILESTFPAVEVENCRTVETLSDRLMKPKDNLDVAILAAKSKRELGRLLSIQNLLDDLRVILILPDRESGTISKGHKLRPRFLTDWDCGLGDVAAVLGKMLPGACREKRTDRRCDPAAEKEEYCQSNEYQKPFTVLECKLTRRKGGGFG